MKKQRQKISAILPELWWTLEVLHQFFLLTNGIVKFVVLSDEDPPGSRDAAHPTEVVTTIAKEIHRMVWLLVLKKPLKLVLLARCVTTQW